MSEKKKVLKVLGIDLTFKTLIRYMYLPGYYVNIFEAGQIVSVG